MRAFAAAARRAKVRWYLFGAQAVAVYGVQRTSADVDVTVELGDVAVEVLVAALAREGLRLRIDDPAFVAATRVLPLVHAPTGWPVDAVLGGPGLEAHFADAARPQKIGRASFPVIAPEHLIAVKLLAGRPKDLEDVRSLLASETLRLDRGALDVTVALLERALERSDLAPLLEALGGAAASRRPRPGR